MNKEVRVGVAAVILREGRVLLGERIGSHGAHTWATPGGHLELGESIEECAKRETLEETGLSVDSFNKLGFTNDVFEKEGKHYVTLFVVTSCSSGEPEVMEPDKCKQWQWFELDQLPEPLFLPLTNLLKESVNFSQYG
ncbi:nucleotide triphosphate diphosphatase NUDT15 [Vibrio neptunius]|uniref:NUDIX domain-containing protein n=1 Tax=Vibrio neptunius TaxID=170651 RepID=A0ABS3A5V9_9VIBR|nr:NUDIX hydrolase [Vibrio neptunius]MBN3494598.1 NUDIX domain-containing protein [Vibrio neptunius]MBN3517014.1 NUDIX domain-containing protein [Vibrio neptunius]MBN3551527.1 NUDIX domain-containing protein [Vibrio neptunius]MBN3579410.1 NUDIX domain-containing protein [Vibrio neptunius]MCH9873074.1 NUDIX domain-containing protein [Vibrio neptunius]